MGRHKVKGNHFRRKGESDKQPYHYTESGLPDIYLFSGYEIEETPYGEAVSIKDADELHAVIGMQLVTEKKILSGAELRFLRREMDATQAELGHLLGVSDQSVARWEKGAEIPSPAGYLIRFLYIDQCGGHKVGVRDLLTRLAEQDERRGRVKRVFEQTKDGWKEAARAA